MATVCYLVITTLLLAGTARSDVQDLEVFIPEVITKLPDSILDIKFGDEEVQFGNELTPTQVKDKPSVTWNADSNSFYTLCITNPDIPTLEDHQFGQLIHWLVTNIPGSDVEQGEHVVEYMSAGPPKETGIHRYLFLVFKQPQKLEFDEPSINSTTLLGRFKFSIQKFAEKYKLELPALAGNFHLAKWDEYVDELAKIRQYKKLKPT